MGNKWGEWGSRSPDDNIPPSKFWAEKRIVKFRGKACYITCIMLNRNPMWNRLYCLEYLKIVFAEYYFVRGRQNKKKIWLAYRLCAVADYYPIESN